MKESFTLSVRRPRREVFESLTDLQQFAAMSGGKLTIAPVPDRPKSGKGAAVLLRAAGGGAALGDILCENVEWDPPALCTRRLAIKDLPTTATFRFEEDGEVTRVTVELELEPQSMLYKMMLPAMAVKLKSDKEKLLAQLQHQLDHGPQA